MEIPIHMCLELLSAADFLGIDSTSINIHTAVRILPLEAVF